MKTFIIKSIFIFFCFFILFKVTIGTEIKNIKNKIEVLSEKKEKEKIKSKIISEIEKGLQKENYFEEDERKIISKFLKKILKELDLIN